MADPEREKPAKSTNAEVKARVEEVFRLRLDGAQYHDIVQFAAENDWNVRERQIREYMARADKLLVERRDKSRQQLIALHMARRETLYARALNAADYRTALAVLCDAAKLRGLYPSDKPKSDGSDILGDLLREAVRRGLEAASPTKPGPTGGDPGQPGGTGGGGPAADVEDAGPSGPD